MSRPYMRAQERRQQIINVALEVVAQHGVEGATISRIAAGAGVTTAALYGHFASRTEILLAAMDHLCQRVHELHQSATHPNALERLREIGLAHTRMITSASGFARTLFEFIVSPPREGLREVMGAKQLLLIEGDLAAIVREGQAQGSIRSDVDPCQVAWAFVSRAWTEDVSDIMGVADHWHGSRSERMLEDLLKSIEDPGYELQAGRESVLELKTHIARSGIRPYSATQGAEAANADTGALASQGSIIS